MLSTGRVTVEGETTVGATATEGRTTDGVGLTGPPAGLRITCTGGAGGFLVRSVTAFHVVPALGGESCPKVR